MKCQTLKSQVTQFSHIHRQEEFQLIKVTDFMQTIFLKTGWQSLMRERRKLLKRKIYLFRKLIRLKPYYRIWRRCQQLILITPQWFPHRKHRLTELSSYSFQFWKKRVFFVRQFQIRTMWLTKLSKSARMLTRKQQSD